MYWSVGFVKLWNNNNALIILNTTWQINYLTQILNNTWKKKNIDKKFPSDNRNNNNTNKYIVNIQRIIQIIQLEICRVTN